MGKKEQKRVLVVEDDQEWRNRYIKEFRGLGAKTVDVSNIEEAKKALEEGPFTHVICDGLEGRWRELVPQAKARGAIVSFGAGHR